MTRTPSTMLAIGTQAPDFSLPDPASGELVANTDFEGKPLLVIFSCNHCPYVLHILDALARLANQWQRRGLGVVMINANDSVAYPDDSPEKMLRLSEQKGFEFAYLFDASQQVARAYQAACTPDFFLFDASHALVYRGQFDASRPGNDVPIDGRDLSAAVEALLNGAPPINEQLPSMGCNIKWRAGNEPEYF